LREIPLGTTEVPDYGDYRAARALPKFSLKGTVMITFNRILCPTDLTSESDEALRYGVALATAYRAKLFLLYCREREGNGTTEDNADASSLFTASLAPHLGLSTFSELNWEGLVVEESDGVGETIVREATRHDIDLIVIRSRRRPRAAALLGSTAETISRSASCPVLVIHPREREWVGMSSGQIDLQRILVAHDFSPDSELALRYGLSLAQEYQTELHLLHVLSADEPQDPEAAWSDLGRESSYRNAARKLQAAIPPELFLWCKAVNAVSSGKPYEKILDYAKEHEIDLICMGASGKGSMLGELFGSNVERVLRQAPCPVFIARPFYATFNAKAIQPNHAGANENERKQRRQP
jgi:nucleotide-binding universal stress UspA family protein